MPQLKPRKNKPTLRTRHHGPLPQLWPLDFPGAHLSRARAPHVFGAADFFFVVEEARVEKVLRCCRVEFPARPPCCWSCAWGYFDEVLPPLDVFEGD